MGELIGGAAVRRFTTEVAAEGSIIKSAEEVAVEESITEVTFEGSIMELAVNSVGSTGV